MGCKKNLPFKNFFYIITPYLIIYTPLETSDSSPVGRFFFILFLLHRKTGRMNASRFLNIINEILLPVSGILP